MKSQEMLLENLHNLACLCLDFIDIGEDEEIWRRHLLTVEHAIRLINGYYEMWTEMNEMVQSWKEEEE